MKIKNKKIKLAILGGLSIMCLTAPYAVDAINCGSLFAPAIIKTAVKDLKGLEEVNELYFNKFKNTSLAKQISNLGEFNKLELVETQQYITFEVVVDSGDKYNEKLQLDYNLKDWSELLNNLYINFYTEKSKKTIRFDIRVLYDCDSNNKEVRRHSYQITKDKFNKESLAVIKSTKKTPTNEETVCHIYNMNENNFIYKGDEKYRSPYDSYYAHSIYEILPFESETTYKEDSTYMDLTIEQNKLVKKDPKKLMKTLLKNLPKNEVNLVGISVANEDGYDYSYASPLEIQKIKKAK